MKVTIAATNIKFTDVNNNNITVINTANIVSVTGIKATAPTGQYVYNHALILQVTLILVNGGTQRFDIQDVTNQGGWTANQAGLNQAVADIQAVI